MDQKEKISEKETAPEKNKAVAENGEQATGEQQTSQGGWRAFWKGWRANHKWLSRRSLVVLCLMIIVVLFLRNYGSMHKVDVQLTTVIESSEPMDGLESVILSFVDGEEVEQASVTVTGMGLRDAAMYGVNSVSLRPGNYKVHAHLLFSDGNNIFVRQSIVIPEYDAEMEMYLRP